MRKNISGQVIGAQLIAKADGTPVTTGTTTVYVTGDGGVQATGSVGSGACTHEGNGFWTYAPAQAETNYDHVAFTFVNTNAVNSTVQIFTSFPQTGDNFARLGAPAGASISADIAGVQSDTNDIQTRLPAALVSGRIDASVGAMAANVMTAAALAADAVTEIQSGLATAAALTTVDDFLDTEIAAIISTLGTPAGASLAADIAGVQSDTNDIQTRLPAALTAGGHMKSDILAVDGSTTSAERAKKGFLLEVTGTVTTGSSTTSVIVSALSPASAVNDQFKGRIIIFEDDTTTAALRGQATDITAFNHATQTFTVTALTTAPSSGDKFRIV